jgi:spore germination cell wall hydrolase CwlJ-like protein
MTLEREIEILAKCVYGEAGGMAKEEQALVAWCVFQRVDAGFGSTIAEVVTQPLQFTGYAANKPVDAGILRLCKAEYAKWKRGAGQGEVWQAGLGSAWLGAAWRGKARFGRRGRVMTVACRRDGDRLPTYAAEKKLA